MRYFAAPEEGLGGRGRPTRRKRSWGFPSGAAGVWGQSPNFNGGVYEKQSYQLYNQRLYLFFAYMHLLYLYAAAFKDDFIHVYAGGGPY